MALPLTEKFAVIAAAADKLNVYVILVGSFSVTELGEAVTVSTGFVPDKFKLVNATVERSAFD